MEKRGVRQPAEFHWAEACCESCTDSSEKPRVRRLDYLSILADERTMAPT